MRASCRPGGRGAALVLCLALGLGGAPPARGWGFGGHRLVTTRATRTLPPEMRPLFEGNADWLAEHSIDPDLWRGAGHEREGPNHYVNLDAFGAPPFADFTLDEAEHLRRHGEKARDQGRVPWRAAEVYAELVRALRAGDTGLALRHAAVLSHYVADAHVPLHAAVNYDGADTGQKGIHARWESVLFERYEQQLAARLQPAAAGRVDDPAAFVLDALRASFAEVPGLLASDLACRGAHDLAATPGDDRYDDAYYTKMYAREEIRLVARLTASAEAVGGLWRSAWEDAGRPALDASFRFAHVRGRSKVLLLSLDGAAAEEMAAAAARGVMPHLARLRASGATARGLLPPVPAKTAPGHAALFTGAWSDRNGVSANQQPRPGASLLESDSGFASSLLRAEPLWVTAARQGLRATVVSGPQSAPFAPFTSEKRFGADYGRGLTLLNGYQTPAGPETLLSESDVTWDAPATWPEALPEHAGAVRTLTLPVAGVECAGLLFDDPKRPGDGFDTLLLRAPSGDSVRLHPVPPRADADAFQRLVLRFEDGRAAVFVRLFELAKDGSRLRLFAPEAHVLTAHPGSLENALLAESGGFVGNSGAWTYERGGLGPTLWQGGDGTAERRLIETAALALRQFGRLAEFARERTAWDLLVLYVPFPDDYFHVWLGRLDPALPSHDAALAARLRPFVDQGLGLLDAYVGRVTADLPRETFVALAADHGQVGVDRKLRVNVALREAGLLGVDARGEIDLARTQALFFKDSGYVVLNRAARPQGQVPPEQEDDVARRVRQALLRVRDDAGRPLVTAVTDARRGGDFGVGPPHGGDLYLSLAPGVMTTGSLDGPPFERLTPRGHHQSDPRRPGVPSALLLAGPGIAPGTDLLTPRAIDVAPTLACLLGLDPPAQATGQVMAAACSSVVRP